MATVINGTDNTAATPALTGTDTDTGVFFPAANTMAFSTGGTEQMRIDSAGSLNFAGTGKRITGDMSNAAADRLSFQTSITNGNTVVGAIPNGTSVTSVFRAFNSSSLTNVGQMTIGINNGNAFIAAGALGTGTQLPMAFETNNAERMRIDTSGNLLVGTTSVIGAGLVSIKTLGNSQNGLEVDCISTTGFTPASFRRTGSNGVAVSFVRSSTEVGTISITTTATAYNTSSDYRLKENIAPMTGALAKVAQLKPVTYKWKADGSNGQGFIAHELQEVVPDCVTGEKDGVETVDEFDEDGKKIGTKEVPRYQGIDTSFLVATLTAAIQELKATVDAQAARIAALEAKE